MISLIDPIAHYICLFIGLTMPVARGSFVIKEFSRGSVGSVGSVGQLRFKLLVPSAGQLIPLEGGIDMFL